MKKLQLLLLLLLSSSFIHAQVNADFSFTQIPGCGQEEVHFFDQSTSNGNVTSWLWDFADGNTSTEQNPTHIYPFVGTFNVCLTVTNNLGQMNTSCNPILITELVGSPPIADGGPDQILTCSVASVILDGSNSSTGPDISYLWSTNGVFVSTNITAEVSQPGLYTLTVTDGNGCTSIDGIMVIADSNLPTFTASATNGCTGTFAMTSLDPSCVDCTLEIFDNMGNLQSQCLNTTSCIIDPTNAPYTVVATNLNSGCSVSQPLTISIIFTAPISFQSIETTNVSCFGAADGAISIDALQGGTPPYSFLWSNGAESQSIFGLSAGTYEVTVTDPLGCQATEIMTIGEPSPIEIISVITTDATPGNADGAIDLTIAGGIPPYSFQWSDNSTTEDRINLSAGDTPQSVTITDQNNCVLVSPQLEIQELMISDILFGLLNDTTICIGETVQLANSIDVGYSITWTPTLEINDPNIPNAIAAPIATTTYSYVISTPSGNMFSGTGPTVSVDDDCVWPGDTDTNMVVNHFDLLNIGLAFDSMGTPRQGASFDWMGQPSVDWSQSTPNSNVNYKHIDTDGNGIINSLDTLAITQNFGLTHNFNDPIVLNQFNDIPPASDGILLTPFYVDPDTLIEGQMVALDIILGDASNVVMGLYGIGFSIEYDTTVIVPESAKINFENSWLGDVNADAISVQFNFPNPGRIDAAITRIDGIEMDGFGIFGELIITLEDDILLWDPNNDQVNFGPPNDVTAEFRITNYHLINFSEEEILVDAVNTTAVVDGTTSISKIELDQLIGVYPNPAKELFYVASKDLKVERIRIYSAAGELIGLKKISEEVNEFSIKDLPNGIYFIEIQTEEGMVTKKLNVIK